MPPNSSGTYSHFEVSPLKLNSSLSHVWDWPGRRTPRLDQYPSDLVAFYLLCSVPIPSSVMPLTWSARFLEEFCPVRSSSILDGGRARRVACWEDCFCWFAWYIFMQPHEILDDPHLCRMQGEFRVLVMDSPTPALGLVLHIYRSMCQLLPNCVPVVVPR